MKKLAGLALVCLLASAEAQTTPTVGPAFCTELKAVLADRNQGFAAFIGPKLRDFERYGTNYVAFASLRLLPGASACEVERREHDVARPMAQPFGFFICEWTPAGTRVQAMKSIYDAIINCVERTKERDSFSTHPSYDGGVAFISFSAPYVAGQDMAGYRFQLNATQEVGRRIVLRISRN